MSYLLSATTYEASSPMHDYAATLQSPARGNFLEKAVSLQPSAPLMNSSHSHEPAPASKEIPPLKTGAQLPVQPYMQPVRARVFLPQGRMSDFPLLLDLNNAEQSLNNFLKLSNDELSKQERSARPSSDSQSVFFKALLLIERAFPRMQPKSRTSIVKALSAMRFIKDLRSHDKEKVLAMLDSAEFKKHLLDAGLLTSEPVAPRRPLPAPAPALSPSSVAHLEIPVNESKNINTERAHALSLSPRFSLNTQKVQVQTNGRQSDKVADYGSMPQKRQKTGPETTDSKTTSRLPQMEHFSSDSTEDNQRKNQQQQQQQHRRQASLESVSNRSKPEAKSNKTGAVASQLSSEATQNVSVYTFEVKPIDLKARLKESGIGYTERDKLPYKLRLKDKTHEPRLEQIIQSLNYRLCKDVYRKFGGAEVPAKPLAPPAASKEERKEVKAPEPSRKAPSAKPQQTQNQNQNRQQQQQLPAQVAKQQQSEAPQRQPKSPICKVKSVLEETKIDIGALTRQHTQLLSVLNSPDVDVSQQTLAQNNSSQSKTTQQANQGEAATSSSPAALLQDRLHGLKRLRSLIMHVRS